MTTSGLLSSISEPGNVADVSAIASMADLTIIIVSYNDSDWLDDCLTSIAARAGDIELDVVVVDNGSDGAHAMVDARYPWVRTLRADNRGFAHANNRGVMTGTGRHVLFLNPDTKLLEGSLADLVDAMDHRPDVGLIGVRQVTADGTLWPTMRYFPGISRALGDALGFERFARRPRWAGERELDMTRYEQETECDWVSGSFMLARREAVLSAGLFDERFFLYSEEPDLCLRMKRAGWGIRHLPTMTILHHSGKGGTRPKMTAQDVFTRRQYAEKHFSRPRRIGYLTAVGTKHLLRLVLHSRELRPDEREAARLALHTLVGRAGAPFRVPPRTSLSTPEQNRP
jgi:N-acetylglucosaminyl-diphospho-decaprenol L-rhamnosyltransferase